MTDRETIGSNLKKYYPSLTVVTYTNGNITDIGNGTYSARRLLATFDCDITATYGSCIVDAEYGTSHDETPVPSSFPTNN